MSIVEEEQAQSPARDLPGEPGSVAEQAALRRRQRAAKRARVLTIPLYGYEDLYAASYRRLPAEETGDIFMKHSEAGADASEAIATAADTLIRANLDLLEVTGENDDGSVRYRSLGKTWTRQAVNTMFGLDLPEEVSTRQALLEAIDSADILLHFKAYDTQVAALDELDAEELPGESEPSAEG